MQVKVTNLCVYARTRLVKRDPIPSCTILHKRYTLLFKINVITYEARNSGSPKYLKTYLQPYTCSAVTRRSHPRLNLLETFPYTPITHKSITHLPNSFAYCIPQLWNDLPLNIRTAATLDIFPRS